MGKERWLWRRGDFAHYFLKRKCKSTLRPHSRSVAHTTTRPTALPAESNDGLRRSQKQTEGKHFGGKRRREKKGGKRKTVGEVRLTFDAGSVDIGNVRLERAVCFRGCSADALRSVIGHPIGTRLNGFTCRNCQPWNADSESECEEKETSEARILPGLAHHRKLKAPV